MTEHTLPTRAVRVPPGYFSPAPPSFAHRSPVADHPPRGMALPQVSWTLIDEDCFKSTVTRTLTDRRASLVRYTASHSFNSFFKVLFIFRSPYLFAIGLMQIFSLMRGIPHILSYTIK